MKYINHITLVLLLATVLIAWFKPVKEANNEHYTKEIQQVLVRDTIRLTDTVYKEVKTTIERTSAVPGHSLGTRLSYAYDFDEEIEVIIINGWQYKTNKTAQLFCDGRLTYDIEICDGERDTTNYVCNGEWVLKFKEIPDEEN